MPAPSRWRVLRFADEGVDSLRSVDTGSDIYELVAELFPLTRSITGDGVRATLAVLARDLPIEVHEVPSGTAVLDWTVPPEWNLHAAWIARADGTRVVDAATNNLHVVGYSEPVHRRMPLAELRDAPAHAPGPTGLDPVPHVLLLPHMGVLPVGRRRPRRSTTASTRSASTRRSTIAAP